jgi:YVTN family beta-propeller protein
MATVLGGASVIVLAFPVAAAAGAVGAGSAGAASVGPGSNLLGNSGAQLGTASARGWDSVTIPGWTIVRGLPTVVRYGTRGYPGVGGPFPARPGGQLFSGGLGGTSVLRQSVALRAPDGGHLRAGTKFLLSAWLGGTKSSRASVTVRFYSASGRMLRSASIGPVGQVGPAGARGLARRAVTERVPAGTVSAQVDLRLATSLTGADGEKGPAVGYDWAIADDLRLAVTTAARAPAPVRPPVARVPRFQHVFLFYFENQDFRSIIGNTRQAPYFNSLLPKGSLLANFYAEEHPSDGNYLALAGGSTFGIPLKDPLEENPRYTIRARNIGDLIDAAHESWKGYLQSADGPCDDTVHDQYWNDDLPMLYFADVRDRPAYCAEHLVPLEELPRDLARASTTPTFSWVSPDDCYDMEGCGIRAGDTFLRTELGAIMRSPAWTTQRSLAIITFDEDNYNDPHPPQRVVTLLIGSAVVRRGYVSGVRYTHYSLLRTIEAGLGLGSLTANDRFAAPTNDVFTGSSGSEMGRVAPPSSGAGCAPQRLAPDDCGATFLRVKGGKGALSGLVGRGMGSGSYGGGRAGVGPGAPLVSREIVRRHDPVAFVVDSGPGSLTGAGSVTPVDLRTRQAGRAIAVGKDPLAIESSPRSGTVYVANAGSGSVTPISTRTLRAGRAIRVGSDPRALAITPDGRTLYVADAGSNEVTPVDTRTGRALRPIKVGVEPWAIGVGLSGREILVADWGSGRVTPISVATGRALRAIKVGAYPVAMGFGPGGRMAYVANFGSDSVTPVNLATGRAGQAIGVGSGPDAVAVGQGGRRVYVVNGNSQSLGLISARAGRLTGSVKVGYSPADVTLAGGTAYVVNTISGTVSRISAVTGRRARPLSVGLYSYPLVMSVAPDGVTAAVIDTYGWQVSLVNLRSGRVYKPVNVGEFPVAVAFTQG